MVLAAITLISYAFIVRKKNFPNYTIPEFEILYERMLDAIKVNDCDVFVLIEAVSAYREILNRLKKLEDYYFEIYGIQRDDRGIITFPKAKVAQLYKLDKGDH